MSFLIAKQSIFDREGKRFAFEVFLRRKNNLHKYPADVPYSRATYIIIELLLEHGLDRVGEGKRVMINVSLDSLVNKAIESLDPKKLIIDIIEPQLPVGEVVYRQILSAIDRYSQMGMLFAVDEKYLANEKIAKLVEKVHIISVEAERYDPRIKALAESSSKTLLITKIEEKEQYARLKNVGDLFQGMYLESPFVLKELQIAPYLKHTLLRLMAMVHTAQSPKEMAEVISSDVGMTAKILRLVNSAYFSPLKEIKSVEQACAMLGLKNLRNFLLVLAMNDYVAIENPELWKRSLARALIAQKIAEVVYPQYDSEAYLIGLFSLIDEILDVDKIEFLKDINISQEIIDGYTGKNPPLRRILDYAVALEELHYREFLGSVDDSSLIENLEKLTGIDRSKLLDIVRTSFEMAENILRL